MKSTRETLLTRDQSRALAELRRSLFDRFKIEAIVLYGSTARGEANAESDIDLLILTTLPISRKERHKITEMIFETNLRYETNFSSLVIDRSSWDDGLFSVLPIRQQIEKDGIPV